MHLFQQMPIKDMVLCNTAIAGYAQEGDNEKALRIFKKMGERNTVSWNSLSLSFQVTLKTGFMLMHLHVVLMVWKVLNQIGRHSHAVSSANFAFLNIGKRRMIGFGSLVFLAQVSIQRLATSAIVKTPNSYIWLDLDPLRVEAFCLLVVRANLKRRGMTSESISKIFLFCGKSWELQPPLLGLRVL